MDEKFKFIAAVLDGNRNISSLCLQYGISRKTGYKWLERFKKSGPDGLKEKSHAPAVCPHRVSYETEKLLVHTRKRKPSWGPRKIIAYLNEKEPGLELPSHSAVSEIFKRRGLSSVRKKRPQVIIKTAPVVLPTKPNSVWGIDFKGDFKMQNGRRCNPLTVSDLFSRYLLLCAGQEQKTFELSWKNMERAFKEFGLPDAILSDNGSPFSSISGLSQLSIWWTKLGIELIRIQPGKPQQNGIHERMHRTLGEALRPPGQDLEDQQRKFDRFRREFNFERPHEALGQKTPASIYVPSMRNFPKKLEEIAYPNHFEIRKVSSSGTIRLRDRRYFVSHALAEERLGLEPIDDGLWLVKFGLLKLGSLDERLGCLEKVTKPL